MGVAAHMGGRALIWPEITARPVSSIRHSRGFYVARKKRWPADASWIVVMVLENDNDDAWQVWEPGDPKPSSVKEWIVSHRIMGLKEATALHASAAF